MKEICTENNETLVISHHFKFRRLHLSLLCRHWEWGFGNGVNKAWILQGSTHPDAPGGATLDTGDTRQCSVREDPKTGTRTRIVNMQHEERPQHVIWHNTICQNDTRCGQQCVCKEIRWRLCQGLTLPPTSRAVHWQCPSSTEHGKSTIFVKLPAEAPIFRVSDKQRTLCNWILAVSVNIYHTNCKQIIFMKPGQFSSQCISIFVLFFR